MGDETCQHGWTDEDGCVEDCDGPQEIGPYCRMHIQFYGDVLVDMLEDRDAKIAQLEAVAAAAEAVAERLESDDDLEDGAADGVTVRQVLARDLRVRLAALREGGDDGRS